MRYEDFVIQIASQPGEGYAVKVLKSPAGEGVGVMKLPFEAGQLSHLLTRLRHEVRAGAKARDAPAQISTGAPPAQSLLSAPPAQRHSAPPSPPREAGDPTFQQLGDQLYQALFRRQIRTLYDQSLGTVNAREDLGLRIKLKLDPTDRDLAALDGLPWEYLCRSDTQDFLGLSRQSPIVRYLDVPRPAPVIPLPSVLRILVVVSSAGGMADLDLEQERRNIVGAWGRQAGVEVAFLEPATVGALRRTLLEKPFHVLHFMGHGGFDPSTQEGVLYFEGADGGGDPLSGPALATKLKDFASLGLVFLNACNTARSAGEAGGNPFAGVASALVLGGLPAVLAMQFPISDEAAIQFSEAFYQRLATGDSVDEALTEGRQAVHSADPESMEWGTPVLFVRVPDGTIFQSPSREQVSHHGPMHWLAAAVAAALLALSLATGPTLRGLWSSAVSVNRTDQIDASHDLAENYVPGDGWEAYFRSDKGETFSIAQPIEQN